MTFGILIGVVYPYKGVYVIDGHQDFYDYNYETTFKVDSTKVAV